MVLDNGNGHVAEAISELKQSQIALSQAIATMVQNQAAFVARCAAVDAESAEQKRITDQRFARIEAILLDHSRILAEHTRILQSLPEAIREKIGIRSIKGFRNTPRIAREELHERGRLH